MNSKWKMFNNAPLSVKAIYSDQITPPRLGQHRVRIASMDQHLVLFWFEEADSNFPRYYCFLDRP